MVLGAAAESSAQGTKDPANFTLTEKGKLKAVSQQSRPTVVQNTPYGALPPGLAIQRVYRDGKLQAIVR